MVAIHGCEGTDEKILLGGLDVVLKERLAGELRQAGISVQMYGHRFSATDPNNICNRGQSGHGVQLELTVAIRESPREAQLIAAIRSVLKEVDYGDNPGRGHMEPRKPEG